MLSIISLVSGLALVAAPGTAKGPFEIGAVAIVTARAVCPDIKIEDERAGLAIALAATEMGLSIEAASTNLAMQSIVAESKLDERGSKAQFCKEMKSVLSRK